MHEVIGASEIFLEMMEKTSRLAKINRPILVFGERGSGKEIIAERLHFLSPRWDKPFIKLNCASLSESLLEAELFGAEQGAYTGAYRSKDGRFARADGGTLFLDEIGTASLALQEKLLRVIEYGEFEKLGGSKTLEVDVRLVAATNVNLKNLVEDNKFRADLLDRLCFDVILSPPLRERGEDIELLAEFFANRFVKQLGNSEAVSFSPSFVSQLYRYEWPGNVRELRNAIERSVFHTELGGPVQNLLVDPFQVGAKSTAQVARGKGNSLQFAYDRGHSLPDNIKNFELTILSLALEESKYNQTEAAEGLQITYHQLRNYLKKHKLIGSKQNGGAHKAKIGEGSTSPNQP